MVGKLISLVFTVSMTRASWKIYKITMPEEGQFGDQNSYLDKSRFDTCVRLFTDTHGKMSEIFRIFNYNWNVVARFLLKIAKYFIATIQFYLHKIYFEIEHTFNTFRNILEILVSMRKTVILLLHFVVVLFCCTEKIADQNTRRSSNVVNCSKLFCFSIFMLQNWLAK